MVIIIMIRINRFVCGTIWDTKRELFCIIIMQNSRDKQPRGALNSIPKAGLALGDEFSPVVASIFG